MNEGETVQVKVTETGVLDFFVSENGDCRLEHSSKEDKSPRTDNEE